MRNRQVKYDLSGKRFGSLVVLERGRCPKTRRTAWQCKCDCGSKTIVLSQSLRRGATKSCGCGVGKATHFRQLKPVRKGRRFGKLKVIRFSHQDKWGNMRFECLCDCGKTHITKAANLRSGKTRSCGCGQLEAVTVHGLSYTPEYSKAATYKRRALTRGEESSFTAQDLRNLMREQDGKCFYCKKKLKQHHVEHKIPISRGGTHSKDNICLSCPRCNLTKHTQTAEEFLRNKV